MENSGKPEVECGDKTIEVVFLTEALFEGRIFVIGHSNDTNCFSRDVGRLTTSILIDKDKCGVVTTRSVRSSNQLLIRPLINYRSPRIGDRLSILRVSNRLSIAPYQIYRVRMETPYVVWNKKKLYLVKNVYKA
ncbi:unnamed protein product [Haemonchus placei]|uniref:ZP domain-containing protein n=1 Tax=Haemonchus placei TaxID=6290 RepID=A0A0N4W4I1_HAEPC|nr:unnamed protein product [Haemonchus placei]